MFPSLLQLITLIRKGALLKANGSDVNMSLILAEQLDI
jgi:hypothetical protein